jgi:ATP-dependent Clp protease ATP-binding subunit ClpX
MCGRSAKQAGKMIYLPGGLTVCQDCMQKTMDMAGKMDFQSMFNNPLFMQSLQNNPFLRNMQNNGRTEPSPENAGEDTSGSQKG